MPTYYGSTGNYPNNPEDYISVPNPGLVNPGPVTTFANIVVGTSGGDDLTGTSGNDTMDGGAGNDRLYGGLGDDSYYVTVGDQVADDGGIDTIYFSGSGFWRLAPNIENIVAYGSGPVDFRGNKPTDPEWARSLKPGWQRERQENFNDVVTGRSFEVDLVAARADRLVLATVKSFFGSRGVVADAVMGWSEQRFTRFHFGSGGVANDSLLQFKVWVRSSGVVRREGDPSCR